MVCQPPSGCCVLKQAKQHKQMWPVTQPPSGCCVLKQGVYVLKRDCVQPAAFGLLCVETSCFSALRISNISQPPLGGCVLKLSIGFIHAQYIPPAAFRRLCVETHSPQTHFLNISPAAFRRLCVETRQTVRPSRPIGPSRL